MKCKLLLVGFLGFAVLFGCSQSSKVEADWNFSNVTNVELKDGFHFLTKDKTNIGEIYQMKDKTTGCYYTFVDGYQSTAITQMFIEKNGVSVPYCEEVN